jgi:hypothetical protein
VHAARHLLRGNCEATHNAPVEGIGGVTTELGLAGRFVWARLFGVELVAPLCATRAVATHCSEHHARRERSL